MPHRKVHRRVLSTFFLLLVLVFVGYEVAFATQDLVDKAARPMKKMLGEEKLAATETADKEEKKREGSKYSYDPTGKTDPFRSFIAEQEEIAEKQKRKPKTYLETLDLSQLELIAVIVGPHGNYAMVRDSKGTGHVITKGTAIGTEGGVVDRITDREVVIKEDYKDFRGNVKQKEIAKKLPVPMM
jgi:type IV pilus assembly protein PilP